MFRFKRLAVVTVTCCCCFWISLLGHVDGFALMRPFGSHARTVSTSSLYSKKKSKKKTGGLDKAKSKKDKNGKASTKASLASDQPLERVNIGMTLGVNHEDITPDTEEIVAKETETKDSEEDDVAPTEVETEPVAEQKEPEIEPEAEPATEEEPEMPVAAEAAEEPVAEEPVAEEKPKVETTPSPVAEEEEPEPAVPEIPEEPVAEQPEVESTPEPVAEEEPESEMESAPSPVAEKEEPTEPAEPDTPVEEAPPQRIIRLAGGRYRSFQDPKDVVARGPKSQPNNQVLVSHVPAPPVRAYTLGSSNGTSLKDDASKEKTEDEEKAPRLPPSMESPHQVLAKIKDKLPPVRAYTLKSSPEKDTDEAPKEESESESKSKSKSKSKEAALVVPKSVSDNAFAKPGPQPYQVRVSSKALEGKNKETKLVVEEEDSPAIIQRNSRAENPPARFALPSQQMNHVVIKSNQEPHKPVLASSLEGGYQDRPALPTRSPSPSQVNHMVVHSSKPAAATEDKKASKPTKGESKMVLASQAKTVSTGRPGAWKSVANVWYAMPAAQPNHIVLRSGEGKKQQYLVSSLQEEPETSDESEEVSE